MLFYIGIYYHTIFNLLLIDTKYGRKKGDK